MFETRRWWVVFVVALVVTSCAPSIDIPPPPNLEPFLSAYDSPTADVGSAIMADNSDQISALSADIRDSNVLGRFLEIVESVREGLAENTDADGNLVIDGASFQNPNGLVTIRHVCTGWDPATNEVDEETNGTFEIFMPLTDGQVGPEVWGTADGCRYLFGDALRWSYTGDIALYVGDLVDDRIDLRDLTLTFLIDGELGLDDDSFAVLQSFRLTELGRLEILLLVEGVGSFVYFFEADRLAQGIRDITGSFDCSLENRQCSKDSGPFSW